jgi:hypothetical protein
MITVDPVSLTVALGAVVVSVFIYLETRKQRKLTEVMVESLAFLQKRSKPRRAPMARKPADAVTVQSSNSPALAPAQTSPKMALAPLLTSKPVSAAEQARLTLAAQREERKRLELQLRQQREQWKRQKDVAKAIGWILDRVGSDDEEDYEE